VWEEERIYIHTHPARCCDLALPNCVDFLGSENKTLFSTVVFMKFQLYVIELVLSKPRHECYSDQF
jgi:hypothetical protein